MANYKSYKNNHPTFRKNALCLGVCLAFSMELSAASIMEEVVVTAQKREQDVQDVPIAISAFNGETLKDMGVENVSDIGRFTAGVEMHNDNTTQPTYNIRGIQTSDFTIGSDPAVALYIDGVYAGRGAGSEIPLSDIERVEVLKGPQGTLFGRNATGGAIHIISKRPTDQLEGSLTVSAGNYGKKDVDGVLNVPLAEDIALRVSASVNRRDGYLENLSGPDINGADNQSYRAALLWDISDTTSALLRAEYSKMDQSSGGIYTTTQSVYAASTNVAFDQFGEVTSDVSPNERRELSGVSLELDHEFDHFSLKSITSYRAMNVDFVSDQDGSADPMHHFVSINTDDQDNFSQEFRFTGQSDRLFWTAGLTYSREHVDHTTIAEFNYDTLENFAIYSGLLGNVDAFSAFGLGSSALGLNAGSSDQEIAEVVNQLRQGLTGLGLNGIALSSFVTSLYAAQPDPTGAGSPFGALQAIASSGLCPGGPYDSIGSAAAAVGINGAIGCSVLPQIQSRLGNSLWQESVRNTGEYQSYAVYGDITYALTDKLNLSAGLRYTYDDKMFTIQTAYDPNNYFFSLSDALGGSTLPIGVAFYNNGINGNGEIQELENDWEAISGRLVLDYVIDDNAMLYASVATGFKAGGFNSLSFGPGIEPTFSQEEVINYEVGMKADFFDSSLRINSAAYFYDYDNLQELALVGSPIPTYNLRSAKAEGQGFDLEVFWAPSDNLVIAGNYSYLDTKYTEYPVLFSAGETIEDDKTGEPRAMTPENKVNLMLEYTWSLADLGELVLRGDYNWTDDRVGGLAGEDVPSYELLNARVSFMDESGDWSVSLWSNNLTDEEVLGEYSGPASAIGSHTIWRLPPRTYGIDVSVKF